MSLKRTPFFEEHVALGARMVPFAGFELPVQYAGVLSEHHAVRTSAGLFDVSHMGEVWVRGPKALAAVQHLITNDASRLADGEALYTCMCAPDGGVVDDLVVYRMSSDSFLICVNAANRDKDYAFMCEHNPHGASIEDEGERWAQIAIQGPRAIDVVRELSDRPIDGLRKYTAVPAGFAGVAGCTVARTGYTGEDGFEVFIPSDRAAGLWSAVLAAGEGFGLVPVGLGARDTLRLEAGMPLYGHELTDETTPWQAGLARIVAIDKAGGFVGRDALVARRGKGLHRLVGLRLDGKRIARDGMPVQRDGADVGWVTSGTRSPTLDVGIAMAYVRPDLTEPGTPVVIDVRGKPAEATVCRLPFYKLAA